MWTTGYLQPILESSQDLSNMEGVNEDGMITLKFTRPRNTGDSQDVAFTNDKGELVLTLKCNQGWGSTSSIKHLSSRRVLLLEKCQQNLDFFPIKNSSRRENCNRRAWWLSSVAYFDQHLGAVHSKPWLKSSFFMFLCRKLKKTLKSGVSYIATKRWSSVLFTEKTFFSHLLICLPSKQRGK